MNNTKEFLLNAFNYRYACKKFDDEKKISNENFSTILECGRLSPSSFGYEPWRFLVLQNVEIREKIKPYTWGAAFQLPTSSHYLVLLARKSVDTVAGSDYSNYMMKEIQKLPDDIIKAKYERYSSFQNSDFDLTDERKLFDWASKQVYIPLANMMNAAAMMGIDSCPIEGFNRKKVEDILIEEGLYDSEHFGVAVMAAFGYRAKDQNVRKKTRRPKDTVVEWIE